MKAFTYERVSSPAQAAAAVVRHPGAKFIAGGTNLLDRTVRTGGMRRPSIQPLRYDGSSNLDAVAALLAEPSMRGQETPMRSHFHPPSP